MHSVTSNAVAEAVANRPMGWFQGWDNTHSFPLEVDFFYLLVTSNPNFGCNMYLVRARHPTITTLTGTVQKIVNAYAENTYISGDTLIVDTLGHYGNAYLLRLH